MTGRLPPGERLVVGWREWVRLPALSEHPVKAKVDTGARTSSLHAWDVVVDGDAVTFSVHPHQGRDDDESRVTLPVHDVRHVRSSSGEAEERVIVRTPVRLGAHELEVELSLTDRDAMGFRMLLGRTAMKGLFVVDPARSYVRGHRPPAPDA